MIYRRHVLASLALIAAALALSAGAQAQGLIDSDADGMPDVLEERLSSSPLVVMEADPNSADTDADGVPDLAEWVLTGHVSDPSVPSVVPAVRMFALRAPGESFARIYIGTVGDPDIDYDQWIVARSHVDPLGVKSIQALEPYLIAQVSLGATDATMQGLTIRIHEISEQGTIGIAAGGEIGSDQFGETLTLFISGDDAPMVEYHDPLDVHLNHEAASFNSVILPLDSLEYLTGGQVGTDPPPPPEAAEICGAKDRREPTGTPGLLQSVVLATGCTSGEWACPAGVCTMSGVGDSKMVLDIFSLLSPPSGG